MSSVSRRRRPVRVVAAEPVPPRRRAPRRAAAAEGVLTVSARDRAIVGPELAALVAGIRDSGARAEYEALLSALDAGQVSGPALEKLGAFLELGLTTGRFKGRLGQHGEDSFRRIFEKTPRGAALASSADEVTKALQGLVGTKLESLRLSLVRPGSYRLVLESDALRVSIGLAPGGATVESLELQL